MSKVAIIGSRSLTDINLDSIVNESGFNISEVFSGGAKGVDTLAEYWATKKGISLHVLKADWNKYGRSAGMIRNKEVARLVDAVIAIWDGSSKGTKQMIEYSRGIGLPVFVKIITYESYSSNSQQDNLLSFIMKT